MIEVVQKGYRLGDRVLRPARVVVAAPEEGRRSRPSPTAGSGEGGFGGTGRFPRAREAAG